MAGFTKTIDMVLEFHNAMGLTQHTAKLPRTPSPEVCLARIQMLIEEVGELAHAMGTRDKTEILDALCDIQYFLDGTFLACGMADVKQEAMEEVHRTNMAKFGPDGKPIIDESGRIVKPEGWKPPNLEWLVE